VNSLAISGFRGGGLAIQGFSGLLGAPVPPAVTISGTNREYGAGKVTDIRASEGQLLIGPWQTVDRTQLEIKVYARGTSAFDLNYEYSTDRGTTWYVGDQRAAATVSEDDGGAYPYQAHFHLNVGYWWRVGVYNTGGSALDIAFEWRLHEF
jgi:hypothetical protein